MSRKFLKYQFKQYIPVLCVVLVYLLAVVFLYSISTSVSTMSSMTENGGDNGISFIYTLTLTPTIIFPFFVYQYRTDKRAVDAFYQVPVKAKEIRRTRMIILLSSLLILFTAAFWLMVLILYVRQVNTKPTDYSYVIMYNYVYYIPIYFLYLICICLNFFIVSFFASFGNCLFDSIIYVGCAEIILGLFVQSFYMPYYKYGFATYDLYYIQATYASPLKLITSTLGELVLGNTGKTTDFIDYYSGNVLLYMCLGVAVYVVVGALSTYFSLTMKDYSGEYAGTKGGRGNISRWIIHAAMIMVGITMSSLGTLLIFVGCLCFVFWVLGYYLLLVMFYKKFALPKRVVIEMVSCIGFVALYISISFIVGHVVDVDKNYDSIYSLVNTIC